MQINSISDFRKAMRNGPYAWPGGYPLYFICDDNATLCCKCAKAERRNILEAIADDKPGTREASDWRVCGVDINWEDTELACDHCNETIESAYGE